MFNFKSNKFYFFIVGYTAIFVLLAVFGGKEAGLFRAQRKAEEAHEAARIAAITKNKAFFNLPRMDLSLNSTQGEMHRMRLGITLEMDQKSMDRFESFQPRVSDRIVNFLGDQDIDKFRGPNGMYNLRHDILFEANKASGPVVISDVIFRELVIR